MHTLQPARLGQIGQIAANGLKRHAEMQGQFVDRYLAIAAGDFENLWLTKTL